MVTEVSAGAFLPLGDFLTAEEPVWVWDALARRILWANRAGQAFWGAGSLEALQVRRFSSKNKSVERLSSLAKQPGVKETVETLTLHAASGPTSLKCYIQGLLVAGGRPGFIVKALDYSNGQDKRPARTADKKTKKSVERKKQNKKREESGKSDRAALDAIAARLKSDETQRKLRLQPDQQAKSRSAKQRGGPPGLDLQIRELSHEMRNPLTVISGFAERIKDLAQSGEKQAKLLDYADDIMESARLAIAILNDFTIRAGMSQGQGVEGEPADFRSAIESSIRLITPLADGEGIKVYKRVDKDLPHTRIADRVLKQILLNLLMNAARHQKTGKLIKVSARCRKDGTVRLAVADNGQGMTKKEIKTAMARPPQKRPRKSGGSGVGLPLVKRLVENAGGQFSIKSERGKGTKFQILFPPFS